MDGLEWRVENAKSMEGETSIAWIEAKCGERCDVTSPGPRHSSARSNRDGAWVDRSVGPARRSQIRGR